MNSPRFLQFNFDIDRYLHGSGPFTAPISLKQNRIYILPNRQGFIFVLLLFVMFIGSVNYANSLGFILTFAVTSVMIVSIIHSFRNLIELSFWIAPIEPVHCKQLVKYPVRVNNPKAWTRYNIKLGFNLSFNNAEPISCNIQQDTTDTIVIRHATLKRGIHPVQRVKISSEYPFGLVHSWAYLQLNNQYLVYPSLEGTNPLPPEPMLEQTATNGKIKEGVGDFSGLRVHKPGESPGHIHWKLVAQERGVFTKQFSEPVQTDWCFDWQQLPQLDTEKRLSQLCRWIVDAEQQGLRYSLSLPNNFFPTNHGFNHKTQCLEALALYSS